MVLKFFIICLCIIIICMANYDEKISYVADKKDKQLMITFAKEKYKIFNNNKMAYVPIELYIDKEWEIP